MADAAGERNPLGGLSERKLDGMGESESGDVIFVRDVDDAALVDDLEVEKPS